MINLRVCLCALGTFVLLYAVNAQRFGQPPSRIQGYSPTAPPPRAARAGGCQENNARYPVTGQCDAYLECRDGVAEEKLCPDGLLFNANASVFSYPCQYPIDVDCAGRQGKQAPNPTGDCPHQFGYFRVGSDPSECSQFMNCVDGRGYLMTCPEGLAFSVDTYRCDWPDMVPDCDAEAFLGFTCPPAARDAFFGAEEYRFFRSPNDCQRYYVCVNSRPRLNNCGEGNAFNELINACDGIENVTSCAGGFQQAQGGFQNNQLRF